MRINHDEITVEEENIDGFPYGAHLLKLENPITHQEPYEEGQDTETRYVILAQGGGVYGQEAAVFPATEDGDTQNMTKLAVGYTMEQAINEFIREYIDPDTEPWIAED